jgi:uncharacterized protein (TIRG00374 family)
MALVSKQRVSALVRYGVCIAAVSWIAWSTDWSRLAEVWRGADKTLLLLSVLAFGPAPVIISLRLKLLLDVHDLQVSFWQTLKATFAGNFVINTLPVGTPGGDSLKAYYIARDTTQKHEAVTVVFFDRVIGVLGLVLMAGIVVLIDWHNPAFAKWGRLIGILVVAIVLGGAVYFSNWTRKLLRLDWILSRLPLGHHLQRIDRAVLEFRNRPGRVLVCLILANILQVNCIFSLFLAGWALGMVDPVSPWSSFPVYLAYVSIAFLAGALPIGVMEEVFRQLFAGAAGLGSPEAALSLSLFGRIIQLIWSLPGALIVLRSRPAPADLEELEVPAVPAEGTYPSRS